MSDLVTIGTDVFVPEKDAPLYMTGMKKLSAAITRGESGRISEHLKIIIRNTGQSNFSPLPAGGAPLAPLMGLQSVNLGLTAVNFGLTAAMFLYVRHQFNKINQRLDRIEEGIEEIRSDLKKINADQTMIKLLKKAEWQARFDELTDRAEMVVRSPKRDELVKIFDRSLETYNLYGRLMNLLLSSYPYKKDEEHLHYLKMSFLYEFLPLWVFTGFIRVRAKVELKDYSDAIYLISKQMSDIYNIINIIRMKNWRELYIMGDMERKLLEILAGAIVKYGMMKVELDIACSKMESFAKWEQYLEEAQQKISNLGDFIKIEIPKKFRGKPYGDPMFLPPSVRTLT